MTTRKYSVAEIDQMREAVNYTWLYGKKMSDAPEERFDTKAILAGSTQTLSFSTTSKPYNKVEKTKCVEELLRTYILAGVEPEELE